jgi:hypothetical protein
MSPIETSFSHYAEDAAEQQRSQCARFMSEVIAQSGEARQVVESTPATTPTTTVGSKAEKITAAHMFFEPRVIPVDVHREPVHVDNYTRAA